ncbi:Nitrogenase [Solidesulfovibrio carbinoliphilus subsp. oakridgensis]|uniref:Nitrogenase n=1 Tax=Solidesulfovibrio carbinoliphilus subsp. oakridgensis TaxID=694327 RepID=G7QBS7_9BACT|nr:nitrogenase component 1 [Solidesulfovibrio carbinoliphilus]EHJ49420.1 Nitrogenase [Solidesulfovibrio carbinoliphilus subsp. oakridgensis]
MSDSPYVSTTNACKLCTPLGAAIAFRGVEGAIPFLHGSQGCATYMRRYIISHFREPMDIASSALGEKQAVFGGGPNLKKGILNVMSKYGATVVGVASTCLTETIGDDVPRLLAEFKKEFADLPLPEIVHVSTPSYSGTHMEGWHAAVAALAGQLVREKAPAERRVNLIPGFVSPADLRYFKEILADYGLAATVLPDISETLDRPALLDYEKLPAGGTKLADIQAMSGALGTIECGRADHLAETAGAGLARRFGVPNHRLGIPIGIRETDAFFEALEQITGTPMPAKYADERGRLVDAYVDGHKYVAGKRAIVYGEEDFVIAMVAFLAEIGVKPILAATGATCKNFKAALAAVTAGILPEPPEAREGVDFFDIAEQAEHLAPDLLVGHSKGYRYAKSMNVPLMRVGFPIHDRFGGQRMLHVGYRGTQALFDLLVNTLLERKQEDSAVGYGYL